MEKEKNNDDFPIDIEKCVAPHSNFYLPPPSNFQY